MSNDGGRLNQGVDGITAEAEASGADSQTVIQQNIAEAAAVAELVQTTLGPQGRDKIIYRRAEKEEEGLGDYFQVTNSGAYILNKVSFDAPAASMISRVAAAQDDRHGDGATAAIVYAGRILKSAADLIDQGFHPRTIIAGIDRAVPLVDEAIDTVAVPIQGGDRDRIADVVHTTLAGTITEPMAERLVEWLQGAVADGALASESVSAESLRSGSLSDSEFVDGMVIKKSFAGNYAPERLSDCRVAMTTMAVTASQQVNDRIESGATDDDEQSLSIGATSVADLKQFTESERKLVEQNVQPLVDAGIDVLLVANRVDDATIAYLNRANIAVVRNADRGRLQTLAKNTGGSVLPNLKLFEPADAGEVGSVTRQEYADVNQEAIFFKDLPGTLRSVLLHGSTWMAGWEAKRNVNAAAAAVNSAVQSEHVIPGGGATEVAIARHLRDAAPGVGSRETLVIEAVADAFEAIPRLLARTAGMKPIDAMLDLRTAHSRGETDVGVCGKEASIGSVFDDGIVEPAAIKRGSVHTAVGATTTILRIDDVITGIDVTVSQAP